MLPIAVEDIARIEVTRGPDSASYGPNSMLAIINIITLHPQDSDGVSAVLGVGTERQRRLHSRVSTSFGTTSATLSLSSEFNGGFDSFRSDGDASSARSDPSGHDSARATRLSYSSETRFTPHTKLAVRATYVEGKNDSPFTSAYEGFQDRKLHNYYLSTLMTTSFSGSHQLQIHASRSNYSKREEWTACYPRAAYMPELFALYSANPTYANAVALGKMPSGGSASDDLLAIAAIKAIRSLGANALTPACGTVNGNLVQSRDDMELQDTYVVSDTLRFVSGFGVRRNSATSESYLGGTRSDTILRAFMHAEYKPAATVLINAGLYADRSSDSASSAAPRLGVNWHLTPSQTVRLSYSKGTRAPDLVERYGDLSYTLKPFSPIPGNPNPRFFQSAKVTDSNAVRHEVNKSLELGYLLNVPAYGLILDAKLFNEELTDLVSQGVTVANFPPNNANSVRLSGAEVQATFSLSPASNGFVSYSYLSNHDATTLVERTQYARHSGAIGLAHQFGGGLSVAGSYAGASADTVGGSSYGRLDLVVSKHFTPRTYASLRLSRLDNPVVAYLRTTSIGQSQFDRRARVYVEFGTRF
ncbi:TonB-dependent receptor plug domain-containing protein [Rhodoferax sp.]|uniref:TonB-dependent receptor plug domain-containing protein n=1 Tax=Rhodoferax sp. TaxID=50421 RepID=UPI002777AA4C|nr:TonB-dependent receptor [Rhodoferax sp.]